MENKEEKKILRVSSAEILGKLGCRTDAIDACVESLTREKPDVVELNMNYNMGASDLLVSLVLATRSVGFVINSDERTYDMARIMFHDNIEGNSQAYCFMAKPSKTKQYHQER